MISESIETAVFTAVFCLLILPGYLENPLKIPTFIPTKKIAMEVYFSLDNPKHEVSTIRGFISYSGQRYDFPTGERVKVKMFRN